MRTPHALALGTAAVSLLAVVAAAAPAAADSVATTLTVEGGTLSVASAATSASLGTATSSSTGSTLTGVLPKVTVTDDRGSTAGWTSEVASTDFTATVDGVTETIAAAKAKAYIPAGNGPTLTSAELSAVPATTAVDPSTGIVLSGTAQTFVTATTTASNSVEYTPEVQVTIDSDVVAGTYSATITHTVV
ncbi:MAG: hypothetical protein WD794_00245 [Mycobacteriales bacterium]